jgi:hypothetical protein
MQEIVESRDVSGMRRSAGVAKLFEVEDACGA